MVFNATVNNMSTISWRSVILVEDSDVPEENRWALDPRAASQIRNFHRI